MTEQVLLALLPVIILIGLGMALRQRRILADSFWPQAERLGYYVLLPSLFFHGLAMAHLEALPVRDLALTLILSTIAVAALVMAVRPLLKLATTLPSVSIAMPVRSPSSAPSWLIVPTL